MELSRLFAAQGEYDAFLESKYPRQSGEDRLPHKLLALHVTLAQFAGDCGGLQYWNRPPVSRRSGAVVTTKENGPTARITDPVLERFVEALQLSLSVGLDINAGVESISFDAEKELDDDIATQLRTAFKRIVMLDANRTSIGNYFSLVNTILGLAEMLGFTWDLVENAYFAKTHIPRDVTQGVER